ncbi:hypothetical protein CDAR_87601 [Caerostris darwini]|uniref:Uncharacterized protein n=1 Tax=Caerostris darwini TaxID=1538125 RepID=A0AAV4WYM5_9ARAC|nr:hypothetical protein CDAR_87601 [Caerostris darwini]
MEGARHSARAEMKQRRPRLRKVKDSPCVVCQENFLKEKLQCEGCYIESLSGTTFGITISSERPRVFVAAIEPIASLHMLRDRKVLEVRAQLPIDPEN